MKIKDWIRKISGDASVNAIGERSGLVISTLFRQWNADRLTPETVIAIARAYDESVIDGLYYLGTISDSDINRLRSDDALKDASDDQLLQELARRLAAQHDAIVDDPASAWNMPVGVQLAPAALHDRRKEQSKGVDEEFA